MRRFRASSSVAVLVAAALVLAACDEDRDSAAGPSATVSAAPGSLAPSPEETETAEPLPGVDETATPAFAPDDEVLTVAVQEAATLDPMRIEDPASVLVARQLFEGLTKWDPVRERVEPAAAESWKVSGKGRMFTFKLRSDMTFHDGAPVTARDFKFAFDRIAEKTNASNIAYALERVEGFNATNQGNADELAGVKAVNARTLEIRLKQPFFEFPVILTHPGLVPLRADAVRDIDSFLTRPVGNGAFQATGDWSPGDALELKAFPDFYEAAGVDGVRFVPYDDAAASWIPFVTGVLDVAEIPADRIDVAVERYGDEGILPLLAGYFYGFNLDAKNLKNQSLRMAISRAVDRRSLAQTIYNGTLQRPRGIVPEGMPGFDDDVCGNACDHSQQAARRLIRRVPRKARSVTIEYTEGQPHNKVARAVAADLEEVGLEVEVKSYNFPRYLRKLRAANSEMYRFGWLAEYPSPSVFLSSLFQSDSPDNHSQFSSRRVDRTLRRAASERNDDERQRLYRRAERLVLKQLPVVPVGTFVTHWAAADHVEGIVWDTMGGFDAVDATLTEEE